MSTEAVRPAPPFRWPGGKRRLIEQIVSHCPRTFGHYFEPFLGSGALFFRLAPGSATLSDHNGDLVNFYVVLRDDPEALSRLLRSLATDEHTYYRVRRLNPVDSVARAARFLYLTTLAFNGIYRVNLQGRFNTPYGKRRYKDLGEPENLLALSRLLAGIDLRNCDFEAAVATATRGDLVYLDPPYTVAHQNNGFVRYNEKIFSFDDQRRLADTAEDLRKRGCTVLVSNAHHASVQTLYRTFKAVKISRASSMAAEPAMRRVVDEFLFVGSPIESVRTKSDRS